ncbi:MAG TPA: NAD(P)/FAD-dependent oxidoreductase [Myxococcaceae bacterium]|nr:NAD(P)/FAD-dependent oxidoreductase [Myxococcaceae bacterium]
MPGSQPVRSDASPSGLNALEEAIRRDLELLAYPGRPWVLPRRTRAGQPILDVLIIGGGQSGLAVAFGLKRERVDNVLVVDDGEPGFSGPWRTFARMHTLRTPKYLTGPDLGLPNLSFRAWFEAQHGAASWQTLELIPKEDWAEYLDWYRTVLGLPVRHRTRAGALCWREQDGCFEVPVEQEGRQEVLLARKVVLATGIDGSGRWEVPELARVLPRELYHHTRDEIDFEALRGRSVGVLGAGASAFDNASVALETGASEVHLFFRRQKLPNVNPYRWAEFVGFLKHHADLPDAERWRFIRKILEIGQLPPRDTFHRARRFPNFHLHGGSPWLEAREVDGRVRVTTPQGHYTFDRIIFGSGTVTDLSLRPELAGVHSRIAQWRDRYQPPEAEAHADLARHPYLGPSFELQEKVPGEAPWLSSLYNYTFGCLLSLGFGGASISGMKYSLPRLVGGITRQLYVEDRDTYFRTLEEYNEPEFLP